LFNSVKWGLFQQYACQEQVYEQCIIKVKRLQVGKGIWQKFRLLLEKDYVWKRSAGNVLPCSEPPTTTSNKNLAHWVQYLISPLPAKAEGDYSFRFCPSVRLSVRHIKILSCPDFFWRPLIYDMWLYLDELQFKFEFRSGRMIFGWVMALELVFFVQILSCPDFFPTSFNILTWYLACGYI
jgi:hypothetical protein